MPLSYQMPSPPLNLRAPGTCLRVGPADRARVGHAHPRHRAARRADQHLERAARQVGIERGREAVEAAVGLVLGQVEALGHRVDRGRLVLEEAHCRAVQGGRRPSGSASQTCPPSNSSHDSHVPHGVRPPAQLTFVPARIRYASTILPSASKPDRRRPRAGRRERLRVRDQHPAAVADRVRGLAVREDRATGTRCRPPARPVRAISRAWKPAGRLMPFASGGPSGPYGPGPGGGGRRERRRARTTGRRRARPRRARRCSRKLRLLSAVIDPMRTTAPGGMCHQRVKSDRRTPGQRRAGEPRRPYRRDGRRQRTKAGKP